MVCRCCCSHPWFLAADSIRVRNYEADLDETRVLLADVLDPVGVKYLVAEVTDIVLIDLHVDTPNDFQPPPPRRGA